MKKKILIWANCQGNSITYMFNKYYSNLFTVEHLLNYEFIRNNSVIPDKVKNADIFLYQKYSNMPNSDYDINNLINNYLKKDCIKICFPTLHSSPILFCYETNESNNDKTIDNVNPFGKFFFGISVITDLLKKYDYKNCDENSKNNIIDEIYNISQRYDFISEEKINYYYNRNFEFLENKILSSDVPELLDFIKSNFTKVRLWHNPNHPTGILLNELVKYIFKRLNFVYREEDNLQNINELDTKLNDWVMPIFPSVKKYHNITFDDNCSSWYHSDIHDTKSYIRKYLDELYFDYILK
jgi:hypothetical protein